MQRVGPLRGIVGALADLGVDPAGLLAEFDLRPAFFDDPEHTLPLATVDRLIGRCGAATGCPHFGLLVGARAGVSTLGVIGYMMQSAPDLSTALHLLQRHLPVNTPHSTVTLRVRDGAVSLGFAIVEPGVVHVDQLLACGIAIGCGILRTVCGPAWCPTEIRLAFAAPRDLTPYRQVFGVRPRFGVERSEVSFPAHWLAHPLPGADPLLHRFMAARLGELRTRVADGRAGEVRRLLRSMVTAGDCTLAAACERLGVRAHTLKRRLASEGTSFRALRDEVRHEVARQLLRHTRTPVGDLAAILGYSEPGALTRAFRRRAGEPPRAWRRAAVSAPQAARSARAASTPTTR